MNEPRIILRDVLALLDDVRQNIGELLSETEELSDLDTGDILEWNDSLDEALQKLVDYKRQYFLQRYATRKYNQAQTTEGAK